MSVYIYIYWMGITTSTSCEYMDEKLVYFLVENVLKEVKSRF